MFFMWKNEIKTKQKKPRKIDGDIKSYKILFCVSNISFLFKIP